MNLLGANNILGAHPYAGKAQRAETDQYAGKAQRTEAEQQTFAAQLQNTACFGKTAPDAQSPGVGNVTTAAMVFTNSAMNSMARSAGQVQVTGSETVEAPSLEERLKAKYSNLTYHVADAGSSHWRTRNDYPHYLLYQPGEEAAQALENWQPSGANPFIGSIDGRFISTRESKLLNSVPPGSKAVAVHPKVQERMEQDPAYADEIMARIDAWFAFDIARNEAIRPGCTVGMNQAVAIGEDGSIVNACSSGSGGSFSFSSSGGDGEGWWEERRARHALYMRLLEKGQTAYHMRLSQQHLAQEAQQRLADLLKESDFLDALGETIAGTPTSEIIDQIPLNIQKAQYYMRNMVIF